MIQGCSYLFTFKKRFIKAVSFELGILKVQLLTKPAIFRDGNKFVKD